MLDPFADYAEKALRAYELAEAWAPEDEYDRACIARMEAWARLCAHCGDWIRALAAWKQYRSTLPNFPRSL